MSKHLRLLFVALAALATVAFSTSVAQASRGVSINRTSIGAGGRLTLNDGDTVCDVLLTLTTAASIAKVIDTRVGGVTGGTITNCNNLATSGQVLATAAAPIPVLFSSWDGVLPTGITEINVYANPAGFLLNTIIGSCLYGGRLIGIRFNVSGGNVTGATFNTNNLPGAAGNSIFCPASGNIRGTLTVLGTPPIITLV
ncbi:hypothetical protein [Conexibacter arvalis]|uniref:Uncharacterized protein n=1 Tax=Conexibacter arvalis TaxID=912552 RepID=A0A840IAH4_9ACTN|nr:hypothetical protein [Conexibacter arvalis]MBB4661622.1 hypothetical protein [Conexibacter arvalis]